MLQSSLMILLPLIVSLILFASLHLSQAHNLELMKGRSLMSIKETPRGRNVTFDCSPSGPCIPCSRSEKSDEKYRCSETGYRIRLKCVPSRSGSEEAKSRKQKKNRSALETTDLAVNLHGDHLITSSTRERRLGDSSKSEDGSHPHITYRSCMPAVNEEKLSVLGFEKRLWNLTAITTLVIGHCIILVI